MAPSSGEASPSIMKGVFIAGIIAAFAIMVVGKRPLGPFRDTAFFPTLPNILAWYLPSSVVLCETHVSTLPSEEQLCGWSGLDFPVGE